MPRSDGHNESVNRYNILFSSQMTNEHPRNKKTKGEHPLLYEAYRGVTWLWSGVRIGLYYFIIIFDPI
jgi:hypothetical protein